MLSSLDSTKSSPRNMLAGLAGIADTTLLYCGTSNMWRSTTSGLGSCHLARIICAYAIKPVKLTKKSGISVIRPMAERNRKSTTTIDFVKPPYSCGQQQIWSTWWGRNTPDLAGVGSLNARLRSAVPPAPSLPPPTRPECDNALRPPAIGTTGSVVVAPVIPAALAPAPAPAPPQQTQPQPQPNEYGNYGKVWLPNETAQERRRRLKKEHMRTQRQSGYENETEQEADDRRKQQRLAKAASRSQSQSTTRHTDD